MRSTLRPSPVLLAGLLTAVLVAACGASVTPPATAPASATLPGGSAGASSVPTAVPVTDTPWGAIQDAVPASFPVFPAAVVADPPASPVSGAWISQVPVLEVAAWYRDALGGYGLTSVTLGSALEDGSRVIDAAAPANNCKAQMTIRPSGGSTLITVLWGSGCVPPGM